MLERRVGCICNITQCDFYQHQIDINPSGLVRAAFCLIACFFALLVLPNYAAAQGVAQGSKGWCTVGASYTCGHGSATAACAQQHKDHNPNAQFYGAKDSSNWKSKICDWCRYNEFGNGCFGIGGSTVDFYCEDGYTAVPPGRCKKTDEPDDPPPNCENAGGSQSPRTSNPIILSTGSKIFNYIDFKYMRNTLDLNRVYTDFRHVRYGNVYRTPIGLGDNWLFDFQHEILLDFCCGNSIAVLNLSSGSSISFSRDGSGKMQVVYGGLYDSVKNSDYKLSYLDTWPSDTTPFAKNKHHWKLIDPSNTTYIFEGINVNYSDQNNPDYTVNRPITKISPMGSKTTYSYGSLGELVSAADEFGNKLLFEWNYIDASTMQAGSTNKRPISIKSVSLPDGGVINYLYSPTYNSPTVIKFPDRLSAMERRDVNGVLIDAQRYQYDDPRFPTSVTGIVDNRNIKTNTVTYDDLGRVLTSSLASGLDTSSVSYAPIDGNILTRTLTNALGKQTRIRYLHGGVSVWRFAGAEGVASTKCPASAVSVEYDDNNWVKSKIDEEGRKTTYIRDTSGHPTSITRGAP